MDSGRDVFIDIGGGSFHSVARPREIDVTTSALILKEIAHRKFNFLLSLLAVITAVALFVSSVTTGQASNRETIRLMRDMGLNLRIIPIDTDMNKFWNIGYSEHTMPQPYLYDLVNHRGFSTNHLTAMLIRKISWRAQDALLTGISPEVFPPGKEKPQIVYQIDPGSVYLGHQLAQSLLIKRGDTIDILGQNFTVAHCLAETGTIDDIRIQCSLADAQKILQLPDQINEIQAIDCLCLSSAEETINQLRSELTQVLPGAKIFQLEAQARARREQRVMVQQYFLAIILPSVIVVSVVWIGVLALLNVRERREEIGILRALGYGSFKVASLFLGKALLIGIIGAVLGFCLGTIIALQFGPEVFQVTKNSIKPIYNLLLWSLLVAPALTALAGLVPTMIAVTQDPVLTLRHE
jgi:putative ABC transport system permease protein